jgi:integrase
MATITKRKTRVGNTYTAQIRLTIDGEPYTEAQTFDKREIAQDWAKEREKALRAGAARKGVPLADLIDWYVERFEKLSGWGRSKAADLKRLKDYPIAKRDIYSITARHLIDHVQWRRENGAGPATALNDLIRIGGVMRAARSARGMALKPEIVTEARETCRKLRLVAKARQRDRLPTADELRRLDAHFATRDADSRTDIPMRHIMWFAIYSGRRQEEITRLRPEDNDPARKMGIVRDHKHPEGSKGNHRRFRYTDKGWVIMERFGPFPHNSKSVGARFTRACRILEIKDLRFHDLRHEATTRLFEQGLTIPEVASYTLHDSWQTLKRYTHLGPEREIFDAPFLADLKE